LGFTIQGSGFRFEGSGLGVEGFGPRCCCTWTPARWGLGFEVQGLGLRVWSWPGGRGRRLEGAWQHQAPGDRGPYPALYPTVPYALHTTVRYAKKIPYPTMAQRAGLSQNVTTGGAS
jgi:hypothetical protein